MQQKQVQRLALGGMLAALVLLATYLIRVPVPATGGYVHPGDGAIFFAAVLLGPYAALIGGIGSALSDLLGGYFVYIAPTFLIKAAMGYLAGRFARRGKVLRNALVFALASLVMVLGYFVFEGFVYGWAAAAAAIPPNLAQGAAGVVIGLVLSALPVSVGGSPL